MAKPVKRRTVKFRLLYMLLKSLNGATLLDQMEMETSVFRDSDGYSVNFASSII